MLKGLSAVVWLVFVLPASAGSRAEGVPPADFQPDPRSVQWWPPVTPHSGHEAGGTGERQRRSYGPAYRYPQAGWIVLHVEGEPYERGVQHGRLLAPEIAAHVRCFAANQSPKAPADGWKHTRTLCNSLFLRRYEKEYLEEMKGIADGASAAGARFDGRPIDLLDVVALNSWPEVETLEPALDATPTGLEALRFPLDAPRPKAAPRPMHCSAFAANGPATADGKIVFGHVTMFSLYPSSFYNVWLDVQPPKGKGHRVFMQSYPAGIQSGLDYYFNDAGLLVCETTLAQTRFAIDGMAVASRIRHALQYADGIDQACAILEKDNNGLYTNEWLLADIKTNEIAMFELGTRKSKLYRSSKNEWFGGTKGFYWGCNNTKDLEVRLETMASTEGRPASAVFQPSARDRKWLALYDKYKGKMDADFGKLAFTTPPLAAYHSVDAKFTTTSMAKELKTWALFGPPLGRTWKPTFEERSRFSEVRPMVGNPWTILHAAPPEAAVSKGGAVVDLHNPEDGKVPAPPADLAIPPTKAAWHGTLLPKEDADAWLAVAFGRYERFVALQNALEEKATPLSRAAKDMLAVELFAHRAAYELGARARPEVPLARTEARLRDSDWHRVASGKGVLLLHELRRRMGTKAFVDLMEAFGKENAGKPVSTAQFRAAAEKAAGSKLDGFFDAWLKETGLPPGGPGADKDLEGLPRGRGPFSVLTPFAELEETLIVYGTADEQSTCLEAALALQQAIREHGSNITVPVKSDRAATDDDLESHHLLLIGRPDTNAVVARFQGALPVTFGPRSFAVGSDVYAHAGSALLAAAENPLTGAGPSW